MFIAVYESYNSMRFRIISPRSHVPLMGYEPLSVFHVIKTVMVPVNYELANCWRIIIEDQNLFNRKGSIISTPSIHNQVFET